MAFIERKMTSKFGIKVVLTKHFIERLGERIKTDDVTQVIGAVSDAVKRIEHFNNNGFTDMDITAKGLSSGDRDSRVTVPVVRTKQGKLLLLTVY